MPVFLVGFVSGERRFPAKPRPAATLVPFPVLLAGWVAQNKLVRGVSK